MAETIGGQHGELVNKLVAAQRTWLEEEPPTLDGTQNFITDLLPLLNQAIKALSLPVARGGGEWTALREALELMVKELDWYAGKHGLGPARLQYALVRGREALAAAAPAPPADLSKIVLWLDDNLSNEENAPFERRAELIEKALRMVAPPPQDGQGAELPPKWTCGNSDHACNLRGYCVNENCSEFSLRCRTCQGAKRVKKPDGAGSMTCPDCAGAELLGPPRGGSSSDLAGPESLSVAEARLEEAWLWDANTTPHDAATHEWAVARMKKLQTPTPSLPEAVAGNASAPVGEKRRKVDELLSRIAHKPDISRAPGVEQYGGDAMKALRNMWSDCPCVSDCTACQLKSAIDAERGAGQPSGVGEPLVLDDLEVALTESIRVDKAGYGVLGPEASDILREFIVSKVMAATVKTYEEGRRAPREVGEGLREALSGDTMRTLLESFIYRAGERKPQFWQMLADNFNLFLRGAAALAAPAPKPAPPAEQSDFEELFYEAFIEDRDADVNADRLTLGERCKKYAAKALALRRAAERKP